MLDFDTHGGGDMAPANGSINYGMGDTLCILPISS
jgi:hypothetical protein